MSRLDYITIAIVAVCILAIVFLVYKMTDLFKGETPADKTEIVTDSVEIEDDVYDYEIDEKIDSTGAAATDKTTTPAGSKPATQPQNGTEYNAGASTAEDDTETETTPTRPALPEKGGRYLVLAGAFTKKALAENHAAMLRKKGYENAAVEIFDRGKYAVVLVDRYDSMSEAEMLLKKLKGDGINSYIKLREASN